MCAALVNSSQETSPWLSPQNVALPGTASALKGTILTSLMRTLNNDQTEGLLVRSH